MGAVPKLTESRGFWGKGGVPFRDTLSSEFFGTLDLGGIEMSGAEFRRPESRHRAFGSSILAYV